MNEHFESIKNKTVCTECGNKEMDFRYQYEAGGAVKKMKKVLGLQAFTGTGNMLLITCTNCGFIAKSFAIPN